jgi:lysophospholipid acyltransferase (LPLAT)-like uncharacterized protein
MADPVKSLLKSDLVRRTACALAALWIRLVHVTSRWQVMNDDAPNQLWDDGKPFIVAFWHNRLMMLSYIWRKGLPMNMLISQHRDGELIANTIAHLGINSVRGSSSRDGAQALRTLVKALKNGESIGITPDGPRGPRMRASDGVVSIARLAGVPILPATVATSRRRVLGSWDRFLIALPFSRGVYIWGEPVHVPRDASDKELADIRLMIENKLIDIGLQADELCGQPAIDPAPVQDAARQETDTEKTSQGAA